MRHRPGQGARHRPVLRHLRQRDRRLQRLDRPVVDRPRDRQAVRHALPDDHHRRHGRGAAAPARPPRHRQAARRRRRVDGRHAGPRAGGRRIPSGCTWRSPWRPPPGSRPGHRLQRGRPPGDHGRPRLARRRLLRRQAAVEGARRRPHGRPHHLPLATRRCRRSSAAGCRTSSEYTFTFDADFEVESYLRHQGLAFTNRFDANTYLYITRAIDYFDLSRRHGSLVAAFRDVKSRFLVHVVLERLAVPAVPAQGDRQRACARRTSTSATTRSRATTATTPSCSSARRWRA